MTTDKASGVQSVKRLLQRLTGVHRIHHVRYGFGLRLPFVGIAFFPRWISGRDERRMVHPAAWRRVDPREYHDCTATGRY